MAKREQGYTLVELVVVILIFSLVMTLISASFSRIVAGSSQITKAVETDIGGLVGLELLRHDLEVAGIGLPWALSGVTYRETSKGQMVPGHPGTAAASFNDDPPAAPAAYKSGNGVGYNGSDYLVLKGTPVGMSDTSRCWSYLNYASGGVLIKPSKSEVELVPGEHARTIVLKSSVRSGAPRRELVTVGENSSVFTLFFDTPLHEGFRPRAREDQYLVYGVAPAPEEKDDDGNYSSLLYPYNRADYYIKRDDDMTPGCAGHTGVLFKTTFDHNDGTSTYPILDCVADLQVVFLMETSNDGTLVQQSDISGFQVEELRELLKEVRVYVMVQQGKREPGYRLPVRDPNRAMVVGNRVWQERELADNGWLQYRWKVYTIVVQPKNL